jgi:hypothetical protein
MDRFTRTFDVIKKLNLYNNNELPASKLLDEVCDYFDYIKDENLDDADKRFLMYLSNKAGVPHYYDILEKFNPNNNSNIDDENFNLNSFSSIFYESSLYTDQFSKLHKYQKEILDLFRLEHENRFFLSASTSFGKTHLAYEIIKKMKYKNIVLIFPSIALLSENLSKIKEGKINFSLDYKIHTLSDGGESHEDYNIFIFTPERFLSFLDKKTIGLSIDFIFVDEVYKIDNGYIIDNESKENERDVAYRMSIFYGLTDFPNIDLLLAGPYIEIFNEKSETYNPSFDLFLKDFRIQKLLRNDYEIVRVEKIQIEDTKNKIEFDNIEFDFSGTAKKTKKARIQEIINRILIQKENAIVYCNTQANAEKVANEFERGKINNIPFKDFLDHLKTNYDDNWIVIKGLEKGVCVHHGVVPKYIQKEIVNLFNSPDNNVDVLVSTTTITEGVNTTAKNMIVYKSEKGGGRHGKPLLTFDAKNIAGRAGRFMEHYKGRVISLDRVFIEVIENTGDQITHKNYDINVQKKEIDDEMTPSEYLDERSKERMREIYEMQEIRGIPDNILTQFKVISRRDKILIFDKINALGISQQSKIKKLIRNLNSPTLKLDKEGFQTVLDLVFEFIENENLKALIENKFLDRYSEIPARYSIIYASLNSYLTKGFKGVYSYNLDAEKDKGNKNAVNTAMRNSATLIYSTFKYQLVKYLGVFNLMYKFWRSKNENIPFEETPGIDKLLTKLEYNAFSDEARIASDFGVPQKIVEYYDSTPQDSRAILDSFDNYERKIYLNIKKIIEE